MQLMNDEGASFSICFARCAVAPFCIENSRSRRALALEVVYLFFVGASVVIAYRTAWSDLYRLELWSLTRVELGSISAGARIPSLTRVELGSSSAGARTRSSTRV